KPGIDYQILYNQPFIITCDFNATEKPMSWTIGQRQGVNTYWIKSLSYQYTNTIQMCEILDDYLSKFPSYPKVLHFYGDYSGKKYTSNSAYSDWDIIKNYFIKQCSHPVKLDVRTKQTESVRDRVASTNAQLCNANNERRMFVDPQECKPLIRDWDRAEWKPNGMDLDDSNDLDTHNSDSVDYYSDYEFPIKGSAISKQF